MPCTREASLFYSFYSQSIIASLSSLSLSFICRQLRRSSLTAHVASPPKISHCAACLSLPFRSSVVATRGRPCSVRRKRVHALPHLPLRLSFLSSPPVTDTTRYQRRVTWFFPPDQSFNSVPRSFTAFFSTSVVALRPPSVRKWSTRLGSTRSNSKRETRDITGARRSPSTIHRRRVGRMVRRTATFLLLLLLLHYYYYYLDRSRRRVALTRYSLLALSIRNEPWNTHGRTHGAHTINEQVVSTYV